MTTMLLLLLLMLCLPVVRGYASLASRVPNGAQVPHPCKEGEVWEGLGHFNAGGGGHRNLFGLDFKAANLTWSTEFCRKDSDGDGKTNGEELGDPECTWQPGAVPKFTSGLSHPGVCEPMDSIQCRETKVVGAVYRVQEEWLAEACKSDTFTCPGIDQPGTKNMTLRLPTSKVPAKETTYECIIFDLGLASEDLHMIASTPVLDNRQVMHHIVLFGCTGEVNDQAIGVPHECGMVAHKNCSTFLSIWTLGQNGECSHSGSGIRLGLHGYRLVGLQLHWNNPELSDQEVDSSGLTLYYTPNLRTYDSGVLLVGDAAFSIPGQRKDYLVRSTCTPACTRNVLREPVYVTAALNHMHYMGFSQSIEHVRNGIRLRYITNDPVFSYDSPKTYSYSTPIEILPGDELITTCHFNSMSRNKTTVFGDSTQQEMCFGFIYYYPQSALQGSCLSVQGVPMCDEESMEGCHPDVFERHMSQFLYSHIVNNCSNLGLCYEECKAAIRHARKTEPCLRHATYWKAIKLHMSQNSFGHPFLGAVASCESELMREDMEKACTSSSARLQLPCVPLTTSLLLIYFLLASLLTEGVARM